MQSKICINKKVVYLSSIIILFLLFLLGYFSLSQSLLSKKISTKSRASEPEDTSSVMNGEPALDNEFPYFVKIKSVSGLCGGVLISEDFVLTAAHCVYYDYRYDGVIKILIGVNHYRDDYKGHYASLVHHTRSMLIDSKRIFIPKEFTGFVESDLQSDSYDIALIKLDEKAVGIPTISFPDSSIEKELANGRVVTVIGVGRDENNKLPTDLMKAIVSVDHYDSQPKSIIFLSSPDEPPKNTCSGDSGGPAIYASTYWKKYVIGITHAGPDCPSNNGYYTSTSFYSEWITSTTRGAGGVVFPNSGTATKDLSLHPTQHPLNSICLSQETQRICENYSKILPCFWSNAESRCRHVGN